MKIGDFSVLMSVYKKEKPQYLRSALKSIEEQLLCPNQIIIVKDGPLTNELDSILDDFDRKYFEIVKLVINKENKGLAYSLQKGLGYCDNQIIARVDSDDINYEKRFLTEFNYLNENPKVSVVGCQIEEYDPNVGNLGVRKVPITPKEIYDFSKKRNPLNHMSVMFRKSAVLSVGGYEQVSLFEDYFLWIKLLNESYKISNLPMELVRATVDSQFYSRRGGLSYLKKEVYFQYRCYKIGFLSIYEFVRNVIMRTGVRLFPNAVLQFFYRHILRG